MTEQTKRVEITEETGVKLGRLDLAKDDIKTLDADVADMVIENGWGKCADTGETGERKPGAVAIKVDSVKQKLAGL